MSKDQIARKAQEILRIANEAVRAAREENRKFDVASPISLNGKPYYELPDGTITDKKPNS